ncbi:NADPH:quinone oxidoreductase family protein [Thalassobaculum sp.]|uniref:NADPH:quinone oxidoreductase family protein n=1 Tax=Thalassobaculum sp. TaxID=2022740 RepID=UPI0032EDAADD
MRAMLCKAFGPIDDLALEDVASAKLAAGEVRIKVAACGVNFPDVLIVEGKYQFKPDRPFAPGGEVSGTIVEVGADVTGFKVGDAVMATTLWGGFAEEVVTTPDRLLRRPPTMDEITAGGFALTYGTSYHALVQRAAIQPGETLLVLGAAGGVGVAAIQIAKALGARVIAAAGSADKLDFAREQGADELVNYAEDGYRDRLKELTGGRGVDVVYDPVGGDLMDPSLRSMAWNGRYLVVGFASGEIPRIPANLTLLKGCAVVGVFWGQFRRNEPEREAENFRRLFELHAEGRIRPVISQTFPLAQARDALAVLSDRKVKGKIVLTV